MQRMYLVDSSIYIDTIREGKDPVVVLAPEFETGLLYSCGIVVCEVLRGIRDLEVFHRMETFFGLIHTIKFDDGFWEASYRLAWRLDRNGTMLPLSDILIASAALSQNAVLVTTDKHFGAVLGLKARSRI